MRTLARVLATLCLVSAPLVVATASANAGEIEVTTPPPAAAGTNGEIEVTGDPTG